MKRLLKLSHRSEKGFTLIELLIVVAILGIIAAVVIPNVTGFLQTGNLAAANTEAATVKTASAAYYADGGVFPCDSGAFTDYLDRTPKSTYSFTQVGVVDATPTGTGGWAGPPNNFTFNLDTQQWEQPGETTTTGE